jgi:hypothetical protein
VRHRHARHRGVEWHRYADRAVHVREAVGAERLRAHIFVCTSSSVARCLLHVVWCLLSGACCMLSIACYTLHVVCCMLSAACCTLEKRLVQRDCAFMLVRTRCACAYSRAGRPAGAYDEVLQRQLGADPAAHTTGRGLVGLVCTHPCTRMRRIACGPPPPSRVLAGGAGAHRRGRVSESYAAATTADVRKSDGGCNMRRAACRVLAAPCNMQHAIEQYNMQRPRQRDSTATATATALRPTSYIHPTRKPAPATSAPGLGPPRHICIGTGLTPAASALGLASPLPHLHRDSAHPCHICTGTRPTGHTIATACRAARIGDGGRAERGARA